MTPDADDIDRIPEGKVPTEMLVDQRTVYLSRYKNFGFFFKGTKKNFKSGRFICESVEQEIEMKAVLDHLIGTGEITTLDVKAGEAIVQQHQADIERIKAQKGPATTFTQAHAALARKAVEEDMRGAGVAIDSPAAAEALAQVGGLQTEDVSVSKAPKTAANESLLATLKSSGK